MFDQKRRFSKVLRNEQVCRPVAMHHREWVHVKIVAKFRCTEEFYIEAVESGQSCFKVLCGALLVSADHCWRIVDLVCILTAGDTGHCCKFFPAMLVSNAAYIWNH
jgi:hypothetical protein